MNNNRFQALSKKKKKTRRKNLQTHFEANVTMILNQTRMPQEKKIAGQYPFKEHRCYKLLAK